MGKISSVFSSKDSRKASKADSSSVYTARSSTSTWSYEDEKAVAAKKTASKQASSGPEVGQLSVTGWNQTPGLISSPWNI